MVGLLALLLGVAPAPADAATLSGWVRDTGGAGIVGIQVRAWRDDDGKGHTVVASTATTRDGEWTLTDLEAGVYRLDARMPAGQVGQWADRWYDVAAPFADGYVASAADDIRLAQDDVLAGFELQLESTGGLDGRIVAGAQPLTGLWVRVERAGAPDIHHNDLSDAPCCSEVDEYGGRFFMRGLPLASDYRVLVYDPSGVFAFTVDEGPYAVTEGVSLDIGDLDVPNASADPNEPNERPADSGANAVPLGTFGPDGSGLWQSSGARIAPRGGDVDWVCFDVSPDERLILRTETPIPTGEPDRAHPWLDPVLSLRNADGTVELAQSDDDDGRNARIDTAALDLPARLCAVVTMYGDSAFDGTNHGSAGDYRLTIERGNRRPSIRAEVGGGPAPEPPGSVRLDEGDTFIVVARYSDPDDDALTFGIEIVDVDGVAVTDGALEPVAGGTLYRLVLDEASAPRAPFTVTLRVTDGEFTAEAQVVLRVGAVNQPPQVPTPLQPIDNVRVATTTPTLEVTGALDPDVDVLSVAYALHFGTPDDTPDASGVATATSEGAAAWTTEPLPENATIQWRVRSDDGFEGGVSAWSEWATFRVDAVPEPPPAPVIVKPEAGEVVLSAAPAIQVENVQDPDGDAVRYAFEIAENDSFEPVLRSGTIEANTVASRTVWAPDTPLPRGASYVVRARSLDETGEVSPWSEVVGFSVQGNRAPDVVRFGTPFLESCRGVVLATDAALRVDVLPGSDPDGDPLTIELEVLGADDALLYAAAAPAADAGPVGFDVDGSGWEAGTVLRFRARASDGERTSPWTSCDATWGPATAPEGSGDGSGAPMEPAEDERASVTPSLCACSARQQRPAERAGLMLWAGIVVAGLRARRRRDQASAS